MIFWTPWKIVEDLSELTSLVNQLKSETTLDLGGFCSSTVEKNTHRAISFLSPLAADGFLLWLQFGTNLEESNLVYQKNCNDDSNFMLQSLSLACRLTRIRRNK